MSKIKRRKKIKYRKTTTKIGTLEDWWITLQALYVECQCPKNPIRDFSTLKEEPQAVDWEKKIGKSLTSEEIENLNSKLKTEYHEWGQVLHQISKANGVIGIEFYQK